MNEKVKKQKDMSDMTRKEFEELPIIPFDANYRCFSFVILPGKGNKSALHDSGYRCMDFVLIDNYKPVGRINSCSDVIHLDGIGGDGVNRIRPGWNIDCLPKSGLFHIWSNADETRFGLPLSSVEITSLGDGRKRYRESTQEKK